MIPKLVCFDLDDTLLDGSGLGQTIEETCVEVARRYPDVDAKALLKANGLTWPQVLAETHPDWMLGRLTGKEQSLDVWRRSLTLCGITDEAIVAFASATQLELYRRCHRLYEDVAHTLESIQQLGIKLALVTNGATDTQRTKLQALELAGSFEVIAISGELGTAKPSAEIFEFVLDSAGVSATNTWHVGDKLSTDIEGARTAGIWAVWLNREGRQIEAHAAIPDQEIPSLDQLMDLLQNEKAD